MKRDTRVQELMESLGILLQMGHVQFELGNAIGPENLISLRERFLAAWKEVYPTLKLPELPEYPAPLSVPRSMVAEVGKKIRYIQSPRSR